MKAKKMFAAFVVAMFMLTIVPMASAEEATTTETATATEAATTAAATETATSAATVVATATATETASYDTAKTSYETKKNSYESARSEYLSATKAERTEKAKQYCASVATALQGYIEKMVAYIEDEPSLSSAAKATMKSELESDISWLKQATTNCATDLTTTAKAIKEKFSEIKLKGKKNLCKILASKMDNVITKADNIATKIQSEIDRLSAAGKDTTKLSTWLSGFNTKIASAKTDRDAASSKCDQITSASDADTLMREVKNYVKSARQSILDAYRSLKQAVAELRTESAKGGRAIVGGTGELTASGNGQVRITGTGTVTLSSISAGNLRVEGDATVDCSGAGNKTKESGKTVCTGMGSATVTGTGMTVQIDGNSIQLTAKGTGRAVLKGTGTYSVCGKSCMAGNETAKTGSWKDAGAAVLVETGEES